jgi:hypothetical protein
MQDEEGKGIKQEEKKKGMSDETERERKVTDRGRLIKQKKKE